MFTLQIENIELPVEIKIFNNKGSAVFKTTITGGKFTWFNLPQLEKGFYLIIVDSDNTRITKKMLVE
jgi:hypothetical protein